MENFKHCFRCNLSKHFNQFPTVRRRSLGICYECYTQHYGDPNEIEKKRKMRRKQSAKNRKLKRQEWVRALLQSSVCKDCLTNDWVVLEFDHLDPAKKLVNVSKLIHTGPLSVLITEVEKCEIVCSNCHAKRTYKTNKSWRIL